MPFSFIGTYGYFTRLGCFGGEYNRVAAQYGSDLTNGFQSIWAQYATSNQAAVQNLPAAVDSFRNSGFQYLSVLQGDAQYSSLLQAADSFSVNPYTVPQSISVVRTAMVASGETINRPTLSSSVASGSLNESDTQFAASTTNIYGDPLDMTYNEVFTVTVTQSGTSYSGSAVAVGQLAVNTNAYNWPQGSGASASVPITDPATDGLITDGSFEAWTNTNTPTNWDIISGTAGTTILQDPSGGVRTSTKCLEIVGNGAETTQVAQDVSLSINTVYAVTFQAKINTLTATGTFRVCLTDGNNVLLSNDAGTSLSYTRDLNGQITTAYQQFTIFFQTPRQLPSTVRLQVGLSVAATAARQIRIDNVQMVAATPLYGAPNTGTSGPFLAAFSGAEAPATGDVFYATFTNSLGTQSFVWASERMYGMRANGLYWPSDVSPTIPDNLVTH